MQGALQHRMLGRRLLAAAGDIAAGEMGAEKLVVNSGVGVKPYYRGLGFVDDGPYLSKKL